MDTIVEEIGEIDRTDNHGVDDHQYQYPNHDDELNHPEFSQFTSQQQQRPSIMVISRYFSLATITILLTVTCPGNTKLWIPPMNNVTTTTTHTTMDVFTTRDTIQLQIAIQILVAYLVTLVMFVLVHYSNPGFLTKEMLDQIELNDVTTSTTTEDPNNIEMTRLSRDSDELSNKSNYRIDGDIVESTNDHRMNLDRLFTTNHNDTTDDTVSLLLATTTTTTNEQLLYCRSKYCTTCDLQPLIRSHHCKICQRCVATFDHHCVFMGVCIGERNRGKFYFFLICQTIGFYWCTNIVATSSLGFSTLLFPASSSMNHNQYLDFSGALRVVVAKLYVYSLTFVSYIMLGLHTFFVLTNITTFECTKGPKHLDYLNNTEETMDLPFYRGIVQNIYHYCMSDDLCGSGNGLVSHCEKRPFRQKTPFMTWTPTLWKKPGPIVRDSPDWWNHPWKNKYWSCC